MKKLKEKLVMIRADEALHKNPTALKKELEFLRISEHLEMKWKKSAKRDADHADHGDEGARKVLKDILATLPLRAWL